jgi:hypothetical protein
MVTNVADVVAIDLGDVNEADLPAFELDEGAVRGDALDGAGDDGTDLEICDRSCSLLEGGRCAPIGLELSHGPSEPVNGEWG